MIANILNSPLSIALGVALGVAVGSSVETIQDAAERAYDAVVPVATGAITHHGVNEFALEADITVTRHRNCVVQQLVAIGRTPEGAQQLMQLTRIDREYGAQNIPAGQTASIGRWRAWPIPGVSKVAFYGHYLCGDRRVSTLLAEVAL